MIFKRIKIGDLPVKSRGKYILLIVLFFIGLVYFRYLPVSYDFDGTVFSQHLRYALVKSDIIPALHPHHLFYFPCNYYLYKLLHVVVGYQVLEYFHLQLFSLVFGLLTLGVVYKILNHITGKQFFSIIGTLLIGFSWGVWYYSVEAEVDMPGLFFIVSGIYLLFFKPENTKNLVLSALLFSIAAGFHLTNGLIIFSVLLVFIYRKRSFISMLKFLSFYFLFLAVPNFIFYLVTKFNILTLFKKMMLGGEDYFAGYEISYWTPISFDSLFESLQSIGGSILRGWSPIITVISLLLLVSVVTVIIISARKEKDKKLYYEMLSWILPYLLFFSIWAHTNIGFKLNILLPLLILFIYSLSRFQSTIFKFIIVLLVIGVSVINFYFAMLPANDLETNVSYQLAEAIRNKTGDNSLVIIAGCGTDISEYCKIYVPYFARRKVLVLDWMLGKGLSLKDIHLTFTEGSKNKSLYVLSELTYLSKAVTCLLENHHLDSEDYRRFINQFEFKRKIPLTGNYFLLQIE
ncbi:MAG: DUF2723 domain-containing protein [Candidatus Aminicenantes bacterium]|nr:MAG: DUF2723 domain-containing protein [Candidatus Aminicenantes bacterium]